MAFFKVRLRFPLQMWCVKDIAGWMGVSTVVLYWLYNTFLTVHIVLIPNYYDGKVSGLFLAIYGYLATACIISLFKAVFTNPGEVTSKDALEEGEDECSICPVCNILRPPKSHHCRRCNQCVLRMDHHCPWINNCVGEANHYAFIQLLVYSAALSGLTFLLGILHFFVYTPCTTCDQADFFYSNQKAFMISVTCFAIFMVLPMTGMAIASHLNFLLDRTTIDNLKNPYATTNEMYFKADVPSFREVYTRVFSTDTPWKWFLPCYIRRKHRPIKSTNI